MGCVYSHAAAIIDEEMFDALVPQPVHHTNTQPDWESHYQNFVVLCCNTSNPTKYVPIPDMISAFGHYLTLTETKYFRCLCDANQKKHAIEYAEEIVYEKIKSKILATTPGFVVKRDFERHPKYDTRLIIGVELVAIPSLEYSFNKCTTEECQVPPDPLIMTYDLRS